MVFDERLAERNFDTLPGKNIEEKWMFGGVGFLLKGNMLVGIGKTPLIVRFGPEKLAVKFAGNYGRSKRSKGMGAA